MSQSPNAWTPADEALLLALHDADPDRPKSQLLNQFNKQANNKRGKAGMVQKLARLMEARKREETDRQDSESSGSISEDEDHVHDSDSKLAGQVSESSTVSSSSNSDEDERDEPASNQSPSTSPAPTPRPRARYTVPRPAATPRLTYGPPVRPLPASPTRPAQSQARPPKRQLDQKADESAGTAVTERQHIETLRIVIKAAGELAEMEKRCLKRQRGAGAV